MINTFIGVDFGSDSVRAVLVTENGGILAESVHNYTRWSQGLYSDAAASQFRQHPLDYLEGFEKVVREVLAGQDAAAVKGIGIDTTGSTPCAVDEKGVPLALSEEFAGDPDAMFILWKDHTALKESDEINALCRKWHTDYTRYEGGGYSPEWFWAKYLHILRNNEKVRAKCCAFVEHCDWMTSMLAGVAVKPGRCTAGHKAMWHADWGGLPPEEFFIALDPLLAGRSSTLYKDTFTADQPVGNLSAYWAEKLGLNTGVVISGGMLDAHAGAVGAAVEEGKMIKVIGTSTCEMLVVPEIDKTIPGICGQVDGSIVPGMIGLEAGQAAFGDVYAWFKNFLSYGGEVDLQKLGADAAALPIDDMITLDWMNGRRCPDVNPHLTGAIFGINLGTTAPMVFRALVEGTAFGAKRIIDRFLDEGVKIDSVAAIGGIAKKSGFVMQTCADVLNMPIKVVRTDQACALGSAMLAAVASGVYKDVHAAMAKMNSGYEAEFIPNAENVEIYRKKYLRYLALADAVEKESAGNLP